VQDTIEKTIDLKAPPARVWRALTDHEEFGAWFRVALDGPFVVGAMNHGHITLEGYEHLVWESRVDEMVPERCFALTWVPYSDPPAAFDEGIHTHMVFTLEPLGTGTRLTLVESGFASLPDDDRWRDAYRMNDSGWSEQIHNIARHVGG
jgi:uncharacterized protein YndB with AHSA1/START domain